MCKLNTFNKYSKLVFVFQLLFAIFHLKITRTPLFLLIIKGLGQEKEYVDKKIKIES